MKILTNKFVIIGIVLVVVLVSVYFVQASWKKYSDWGAMRYVDRSGNRPNTDPLFHSTGIFVTEQPKAERGKTIEVKSQDGKIEGRFVILDIVQEMRPGKPAGWWIATDGAWGPGNAFDTSKGGGKYRVI